MGSPCMPNRRAPHAALSHQIVEHGFGAVDRNGKADTGALLGATGGDHRVDADHFGARVQQRTAGVAGINRRIRLDRFVDSIAIRPADRADRTDDAARHRARQSKRIADGKHFLSDAEVTRVAQGRRHQVRSADLDHRKIVTLICANHLRRVVALVVQRDFNILGALDHVEVGEDVSLFVENESRTLAFLRHHAIKEVKAHGARANVHHRWNRLLVDADVDLLFRIERLRPRGLRQFQLRGFRERRFQAGRMLRGVEVKSAD